MNKGSNQLDSTIEGVTLNLQKAELGKTVTLTIGEDTEGLNSSIGDFVKKYNATYTLLNNLTAYDPTTKTAGPLLGDSSITNLKYKLANQLTTTNNDRSSPIQSLADLGITTDSKGLLQIDQTKLDAAISENQDKIASIFAKTARAEDNGIKIQSLGSTVKAGSYAVNIASITPGVSLTGTIGGLSASSSNGVTLQGSGILGGLSINVLTGGIGNRSNVIVTDGVAVKLNSLIDGYINSVNGEFTTTTKTLNERVRDLNSQQDSIDRLKNQLTERYSAQYSALDALLGSMQSTSNYLTQQLSSI